VPEIEPVTDWARAETPNMVISTRTANIAKSKLKQRRVKVNMEASFKGNSKCY
jgi:hypothetical protein